MKKTMILCLAMTFAPVAFAQHDKGGKPAMNMPKPDPNNPMSGVLKFSWERTKKLMTASAEEMPAENYSWKPTDGVRTYGQLIGHLADANHMFCAMASKDATFKMDKDKSAEKLTAKADLQKALADSIAYCDKVYGGITDQAMGTTMINMFGMTLPEFGALNTNLGHDMEHYGNLVTYLRMKKLTPPSSQQEK
jgi:uncharacterized damage-inducible protein DinB